MNQQNPRITKNPTNNMFTHDNSQESYNQQQSQQQEWIQQLPIDNIPQQAFNNIQEAQTQNSNWNTNQIANTIQGIPQSSMSNNQNPFVNPAQFKPPQMEVEQYLPNQNIQNFPQLDEKIYCLTHKNKQAIYICLAQDCNSFSRLLCAQCFRDHSSHYDKVVEIEDIKLLQSDQIIPMKTGISERVSTILNQQGNRDSPEYIEKLFIQMEGSVYAGMKKTFKDIMVAVQSNNEIVRQKMAESKKIIIEHYSVGNFLSAYFKYCNSSKSPQDYAEFEFVLNQYAEDYSSEETLEKLLPHSQLLIDFDKFQMAEEKFREAFSILSEVVVQKSLIEFTFQPSTYAKASRFVKLTNNATGVLCQSKDEPMAVFGENPLEVNKCYNLTFNVTGIKARQCWGVLLILNQHAKLSTGLCWPTQEKGLFCCFDGDCSNLPNSLKPLGSSRMQDSTFIVTVHVAERIFKIRNESGTYNSELIDKYQMNNEEKYYLGFALPDCKLISVAGI